MSSPTGCMALSLQWASCSCALRVKCVSGKVLINAIRCARLRETCPRDWCSAAGNFNQWFQLLSS